MDVPKNNPTSPMDQELVAALNDQIHQGYDLIYKQHQPAAGCDHWLAAWELIKQLARPEMATIEDFDRAYRLDRLVFDWIYDLEMELHNAGLMQAHYHEHCIRFVRELLSRFPQVTANMELYARRAEAEAVWLLGQQAEAEVIYQALVEKLPDEGWAYIGWSDQYYTFRRSNIDFEAGEAILLQALPRPNLLDRADVLDRLIGLYDQWQQPEAKITPYLAELEAILAQKRPASNWKRPPRPAAGQPVEAYPSCPQDGSPMIDIGGQLACAVEALERCVGQEQVVDVVKRGQIVYYVFEDGHELPLLCGCCGAGLVVSDLAEERRRVQGRQLKAMSIGTVEGTADQDTYDELLLAFSKSGWFARPLQIGLAFEAVAQLHHPLAGATRRRPTASKQSGAKKTRRGPKRNRKKKR